MLHRRFNLAPKDIQARKSGLLPKCRNFLDFFAQAERLNFPFINFC